MKQWNITKAEGLQLLENAPRDENPSRVNQCLTRRYVTELMEELCLEGEPTDRLSELLTKRVFQAAQDRRCPNQEMPVKPDEAEEPSFVEKIAKDPEYSDADVGIAAIMQGFTRKEQA